MNEEEEFAAFADLLLEIQQSEAITEFEEKDKKTRIRKTHKPSKPLDSQPVIAEGNFF